MTCDILGSSAAQLSALNTAALGRMLFFEPALSADGKVACASCHQPEHAFSDGPPRATGAFGRQGSRNAASLLDVARQRSLFGMAGGRGWKISRSIRCGTRSSTACRMTGQLLDKLRADPRSDAASQAVYGVPVQAATVVMVAQAQGQALAAFERTLVSGESPFDRFRGGQPDVMPPAARRGWVVFDQQAHCTRCHVVVITDATFRLDRSSIPRRQVRSPGSAVVELDHRARSRCASRARSTSASAAPSMVPARRTTRDRSSVMIIEQFPTRASR